MTIGDYERQVLAAVARACRPNSLKKSRRWAYPPMHGPFVPVKLALLHLLEAGLLRCFDARRWWQVQPTDAGKDIIAIDKRKRAEMRARRWRPLLPRLEMQTEGNYTVKLP
jgi:hypothetical protein